MQDEAPDRRPGAAGPAQPGQIGCVLLKHPLAIRKESVKRKGEHHVMWHIAPVLTHPDCADILSLADPC